MRKVFATLLAVMLAASTFYVTNTQAFANADSVTIVSVSPSAVANYKDEVTFIVVADYALTSYENDIVYLGFNTGEPERYT